MNFRLQPVAVPVDVKSPRGVELSRMSRQELLDLLYDNVGAMYFGIRKAELVRYVLQQEHYDACEAEDAEANPEDYDEG